MAQTKAKKPIGRRTPSGSMKTMRDRFGIRQTTQARMLGVSTKTASSLSGGTTPSAQTARRLTELKRLLSALAEIVEEDVIAEWLETPNEVLGGLKPLEVIERGEVDRIWQMVYALRSGEPT